VKRFFTRLSVFRGGWSLAAAAAVCARPSGELGAQGAELGEEAGPALTPSRSEATALDYLQQLREGSMVLAEEIGKEVRFRMLETLREYAVEQLSPAERDLLQRRHAEYYLSVAESAESELQGADQGVWLDRLEQEHDNLRAALQWAVTQEAAEVGLRLCGALWEFWEVRGHVAEGRERLAAVLALPAGAPFAGGGEGALSCRLPGATPLGGGYPTRGAEPREGPPRGSPSQPATRAKALLGAGALANDQGEFADARAFLEESLEICQVLRDEPGIALSLHHLGDVALYEGDWETAEALYEESIAIRRRFGQRRELAMSLESLGTLVFKQGHLETACALYQESLAIRRELQDRLELAYSLGRVGNIALCRGDYRTAQAHYEESLAIFRQLGSREGVSDMLQNLGAVAHAEGDYPTARALFEETLAIRRELGIRRCLAQSLNHLGEVACGQGDCEAARALCEESLAIGRALGYKEGIAHGLSVLGSLALRQGDWEAAKARYQESLALRIELGHRLSLADSLEGLAAAEQAQGEHEQAVRLLGSAASLRQAIGCPLPPRAQRAHEELRAALRAALGEALYAAAWATGRALPWEETAAEALAEPDIDRPGENGGPLRLFSEYFEGRAV
jgi:tetratricopeptide (TPR) repeat protein